MHRQLKNEKQIFYSWMLLNLPRYLTCVEFLISFSYGRRY